MKHTQNYIEASHKPIHVIIIGASGHARVIADAVRCAGDIVDGFLDDREADSFSDLVVLGNVKKAQEIAIDNPSVKFVVGIGQNEARKRIADHLSNLNFYTAIHPSAVIAGDVAIGEGSVIMAGSVLNTGASIGCHCIINTAATVDHDGCLADFVHLSPGVHLSGAVSIEQGTWLGVGVSVSNNVKICGGSTIGAGAVVIKDIATSGTYVGVPARRISEPHTDIYE